MKTKSKKRNFYPFDDQVEAKGFAKHVGGEYVGIREGEGSALWVEAGASKDVLEAFVEF